MSWGLDFISEEDFKEHVGRTIESFGNKLVSFDLDRFNRNTIDPVKLVFDKAVFGEDWETLIASEIFRQRDKSNTNEIGYFHQKIFSYVRNCQVPKTGWDVIVDTPGYELPDKSVVKRIYVEMKNKHNTMNSASSAKTYMKMQGQLLRDDKCVCFLVEVIAKQSQDITWTTTVDGQKVEHNRIRRVSIDQFYEIVTGHKTAFYDMCLVLPDVVEQVIAEQSDIEQPVDIVYEQLASRARGFGDVSRNTAMVLALYMLGFRTYSGFSDRADRNQAIPS